MSLQEKDILHKRKYAILSWGDENLKQQTVLFPMSYLTKNIRCTSLNHGYLAYQWKG